MAVSSTHHRWTVDEYLRAWEAGAPAKRVELLDGEVWDVGRDVRRGRLPRLLGGDPGRRARPQRTNPDRLREGVLYRPGQHVPVPYGDAVSLDVSRLIGA